MWFYILAGVAIVLLYIKYFSGRKSFWEKYGIREVDTSPAISKMDMFMNRKPLTVRDEYVCNNMRPGETFCGIDEMGSHVLLTKDLETIKRVMIKDFDHFVDRRRFFTDADPLFKNQLPNLEGDEWKGVRSSVSPTFTTGKIRRMMNLFNDVAHQWVEKYKNDCENNGGSINLDVINAVSRYTVDVIANTAFGMNVNTIENTESQFAKMVNKLTNFQLNFMQKIKIGIIIYFPAIRRMLGLSMMDMEVLNFFETILDQGLKSRLSGETFRNDFLQLLVEARKGELKTTQEELEAFEKDAQLTNGPTMKNQEHLTDVMMRAQCIVFFFAGFGTTANFLAFTLYSLALYPDVQDKLRKEVGKIVKEDGSLEYDDVGKCVYLDMVASEVLRKFPAIARLERRCVKDYKDPDSGIVIPTDALVGIPVSFIHNSKEYYENPDKFDPEHFSPENKAKRNPYAYMPFGMGPRNCIGMRFALIEGKAAIAHIVHNFFIEPTSKTPTPIRTEGLGFQVIPPKNLELKISSIARK